jgi:DegV family protein with EDD domain
LVAIITDSASNLPADLASEFGITVVPLHFRLGDDVHRDGEIVLQDFYEALVAGVPASTSAPSVGDFLEAFRAVDEPEIVCVTVAAAVSASNQHAVVAAEQADGRSIRVVDSTNASMAEGFVALEAARLARTGAPVDEVVARAEDIAVRSRILATIDSFEFLRKSGRVRRAQAYAATMLNIKPVFRFEAGDAEPLGRPRTRSRALDRIVRETIDEAEGRPIHLATFHALSEEDAKELVRRVEAEGSVIESYVVEATPVIGAHTGPGLVGTAFFCE